MTISLIFSIVIKSQPITLPKRIGRYKLFHEVKKDTPIKNYAIGIYRLGKSKVFIKTWKGNLKNVNYYLLVNEYLINKILYEKLINNRKRNEKYTLGTPKVIDIIKSKNSLSVLQMVWNTWEICKHLYEKSLFKIRLKTEYAK